MCLGLFCSWLRRDFEYDTKALVVLIQLYWEPVTPWDTFGNDLEAVD
jgi:hypothetical protein